MRRQHGGRPLALLRLNPSSARLAPEARAHGLPAALDHRAGVVGVETLEPVKSQEAHGHRDQEPFGAPQHRARAFQENPSHRKRPTWFDSICPMLSSKLREALSPCATSAACVLLMNCTKPKRSVGELSRPAEFNRTRHPDNHVQNIPEPALKQRNGLPQHCQGRDECRRREQPAAGSR